MKVKSSLELAIVSKLFHKRNSSTNYKIRNYNPLLVITCLVWNIIAETYLELITEKQSIFRSLACSAWRNRVASSWRWSRFFPNYRSPSILSIKTWTITCSPMFPSTYTNTLPRRYSLGIIGPPILSFRTSDKLCILYGYFGNDFLEQCVDFNYTNTDNFGCCLSI